MEIVDSIDALIQKVDVVLLTSVDGRPHLAQVTPVFKAGKRVFIDKPLAAGLADARAIAALSKETRTPFFSASSVRFHKDIPDLRENAGLGKIERVEATYLLQPLEFHPDLFYYGIHGVDSLYAVMGTGCTSLSRKIEADLDVTTCNGRTAGWACSAGCPRPTPTQPLDQDDWRPGVRGDDGRRGLRRASSGRRRSSFTPGARPSMWPRRSKCSSS